MYFQLVDNPSGLSTQGQPEVNLHRLTPAPGAGPGPGGVGAGEVAATKSSDRQRALGRVGGIMLPLSLATSSCVKINNSRNEGSKSVPDDVDALSRHVIM